MPSPRRAPARIALELLDCIDRKDGRASKWDLIKVVGTEVQFARARGQSFRQAFYFHSLSSSRNSLMRLSFAYYRFLVMLGQNFTQESPRNVPLYPSEETELLQKFENVQPIVESLPIVMLHQVQYS